VEKIKLKDLEHACDGVDMDFLCNELLWGDGPSSILRASAALFRIARAANKLAKEISPTKDGIRATAYALDDALSAFDFTD
jgi:hypothetical protein